MLRYFTLIWLCWMDQSHSDGPHTITACGQVTYGYEKRISLQKILYIRTRIFERSLIGDFDCSGFLKERREVNLETFIYSLHSFVRDLLWFLWWCHDTHRSVRSINITARRQPQCCVSDEINQLTDAVGLRLISKIVHESPQK